MRHLRGSARAVCAMALNWDDLKVVLAVGRTGSLTGAALKLGIDQSTAGRRLSAIEADLGVILFVRAKTGFAPTPAGEIVIARAHEIENRALRLEDEIARGDEGPTGLVRIIGNPWTLVRLAERALPGLLEKYPNLDVRTIGGALHRSLGRGDAAIALWFEMAPRDAEFAVKLGDVPYAVYAPTGVDAATLGWVSFWDDEAPRRAPARWIERERRPTEALRLAATDSAVLLAAIRAGMGKGLLPMCLAEGQPGVARVAEGPPDLVRGLHLHAHPDTIQLARVQVVMAWFREHFTAVFAPSGDGTTAASR